MLTLVSASRFCCCCCFVLFFCFCFFYASMLFYARHTSQRWHFFRSRVPLCVIRSRTCLPTFMFSRAYRLLDNAPAIDNKNKFSRSVLQTFKSKRLSAVWIFASSKFVLITCFSAMTIRMYILVISTLFFFLCLL